MAARDIVSVPHRSPALDVLRGVAALAVVFGHAGLLAAATVHERRTGVVGFLAANGWKGIYLFFAISGYLISRPFVRALLSLAAPPDLRGYARRRAARILPAHWLALTAMVALMMVDSITASHDLTAGRYVAHLLLVQNLVPGVAMTILPVTWTLGIEALFYVTVPVLYLLCRRGLSDRPISPRRLLQGLTAIWICGGAILIAAANVPELPATAMSVLLVNLLAPTVGYFFYFAPGVAVAVMEARMEIGLPSRVMQAASRGLSPCLLAVTLWVAAGLIAPGVDGAPPLVPLPLAATASLLLNCLFGGVAVLATVATTRRRSFPRLLVVLGETSYGMYLWHWIVVNVVFWVGVMVGLPLSVWRYQAADWVLIVALTLPVAWFSWAVVERPAMAWSRGRAAPRDDASPGQRDGPRRTAAAVPAAP